MNFASAGIAVYVLLTYLSGSYDSPSRLARSSSAILAPWHVASKLQLILFAHLLMFAELDLWLIADFYHLLNLHIHYQVHTLRH